MYAHISVPRWALFIPAEAGLFGFVLLVVDVMSSSLMHTRVWCDESHVCCAAVYLLPSYCCRLFLEYTFVGKIVLWLAYQPHATRMDAILFFPGLPTLSIWKTCLRWVVKDTIFVGTPSILTHADAVRRGCGGRTAEHLFRAIWRRRKSVRSSSFFREASMQKARSAAPRRAPKERETAA